MHYVYSTLSADTLYVDYEKSGNLNIKTDKVLIKGGANVAEDGTRSPITPNGVVTQVNDDQLAMLIRNPHFVDHKNRGFIKVDEAKMSFEKAERTIDKQVSDMQPKDDAAPIKPDNAKLKDAGVKEFKRGG